MSSSSPRDPTRLRHALHPLSTTSLAGYGNQLVSPISAVSMASSHVQLMHTPGSAILPYNPQEWVASPAVMAATERPLPFVGSEAQGGDFSFSLPLHIVLRHLFLNPFLDLS